MVSFSDLLCRVKGTAEERNKYDNMGCRVFMRGIQNQKKMAKNYYPHRNLLYFGHRHSGEPSKLGHHFIIKLILTFQKSV